MDFFAKLSQNPKCPVCKENVWSPVFHSNSNDKVRAMAKHGFKKHLMEEMKLEHLIELISKNIPNLLKCPCPRGRGFCKFTTESYTGVHIRMDKHRFMKQMAYFCSSFVGNKNAIRPQPFRLHFSIDCSFKMRYCMNFYLNWHRNYERSNLELPNSLNKKHVFNFSLT